MDVSVSKKTCEHGFTPVWVECFNRLLVLIGLHCAGQANLNMCFIPRRYGETSECLVRVYLSSKLVHSDINMHCPS